MKRAASNEIALWSFRVNAPLKVISKQEEDWSIGLSPRRSLQFKHSRGHVRSALGDLWKISPLDIPLYAPPGKPPELSSGWGNISFSHCNDRLFIGWSSRSIGVDIERVDRNLQANKLNNRYFSKQEDHSLDELSEEGFRKAILEKWVLNEAAIKWQKGNIASDMPNWVFYKESNLAVHKILGFTIALKIIHFESWYTAIAYDKKFNQ